MRGDENKHDAGKLMWDLLPIQEVEDIVKVLTFGAEKYGPHNWQKVIDADDRYFAAAMRHLAAYRKGEIIDPESEFPHLAHAGCCLLFMSFLSRKERSDETEFNDVIKKLRGNE